MADTSNMIGQIAMLILTGALLAGCGGLEADPVEGESAANDDASQQDSSSSHEDGSSVDTIAHPFESQSEVFGADHTGGTGEADDEEGDPALDPCTMFCLKTVWCSGEPTETDERLAECVDNCEHALEERLIDESALECVEQAEHCDQTRQCSDDIPLCEDVCRWHDSCEPFDDQNECTQWCVGEIRRGDLDWDSYGCLIDTEAGACPAYGLCGVSVPGH